LGLLFSVLVFLAGCNASETADDHKASSNINRIQEAISTDSIKANIEKLASFHTRHTTSDTTSDSIGIGAARRWIYSKFKQYEKTSGNRLKVKYDRYIEKENPSIKEPTEIVNIVAVLPGTQLESRERAYVISGHYDSRVSDIMNDTSYAPGANDDASGTAAVMELARIMSQKHFDATLIFLAVAGEEQGLLGAKHFASQANKKGFNIKAMISNDIIGNTIKSTDETVHDNEVRVFTQGVYPKTALSDRQRMLLNTGGVNDTPSRQLGRFIHRMSEQYMEDLKVNIIYRRDRYLRGGDHMAFLKQGYPAVRISEQHEYYERQHQDVRKEEGVQYGDLPRFVDYNFVGKVTQLNAAVFATLANAPDQPQNVGISVKRLENNSTLLWSRNKEPDLKGYEIVWRKTHAPYWEHAKFVGDTTRFTIKGVSKDNVIFGVRSVDKYGNKSPAVYPSPVR